MTPAASRSSLLPIGVVVRKSPGATRWAKWSWKAVAVLPGAAEVYWKVLRSQDDVTDYHAATAPLELHRSETESYLRGLADAVPAVYVVMRNSDLEDRPFDLVLVTASPYEAQYYADNGEDIVEKVPMPEGLIAWVEEFCHLHHRDEKFVKRRRDKTRVDLSEDGKGDVRISQLSDVYRAPTRPDSETIH